MWSLRSFRRKFLFSYSFPTLHGCWMLIATPVKAAPTPSNEFNVFREHFHLSAGKTSKLFIRHRTGVQIGSLSVCSVPSIVVEKKWKIRKKIPIEKQSKPEKKDFIKQQLRSVWLLISPSFKGRIRIKTRKNLLWRVKIVREEILFGNWKRKKIPMLFF